jgi:hypothetical protein
VHQKSLPTNRWGLVRRLRFKDISRFASFTLLRNISVIRLQTDFQCFTANRVRNGSRKPNFAFTITADVLVEENIAGELDVFTDLLAGLR